MTGDARNDGSTRTGTSEPTVTISTRELDTREGQQIWASALESTYCELGLDWGDPRRHFDGELIGRQFGDLYVSTVRADPHTVLRTPAMIDSDAGEDYLLCVVTSGHVQVRQDGRESELDHGSFTLLDPARPFTFHSPIEFEQVVVRTPRTLLTSRLPLRAVETITANAISGRAGAGSVVSNFLQHIAVLDSGMASAAAVSFSSSAMDMLVTALADGPLQVSPTEVAHMQDLRRAQHALETHLHDPDRSISDVARDLGMSVRYLQNLFRHADTTPTNWLYQARLERARKLLLSTEITINELSTQVGFRDVSHFSRTFRRQFGTSPGQYRRERATG